MFEESAASAVPSIWESMNSWFTPTVLFVLLNLVIGTIVFTSNQNQKQNHNPSQTDSNFTQSDPQVQRPNNSRFPSVLQRLKSINFSRSPDAHQKTVTDSDPLPNLERSPQVQNFEQHSQYFFRPSHQESFQENLETTPGENQYVFQQDLQETQTHSTFQEEKVTNLDFQELREQKAEKNEQQSMNEVYSEVTGTHFIRTKSDTEPASGEIPVKLPAKMKKSASSKSSFSHFEEDDIVEARRPATTREKASNSKLPEDQEVDAKADDFINKFKEQLKLQRLDSIIRYKDMISRASGK